MKGLTKDEIKISVFSKLEKELKKIGIKVAESYISRDRDYGYSKDEMSTIIQDGVLQNIIKSQLSKTASNTSSYILSLDNFIKSANENKWSKLLKK